VRNISSWRAGGPKRPLRPKHHTIGAAENGVRAPHHWVTLAPTWWRCRRTGRNAPTGNTPVGCSCKKPVWQRLTQQVHIALFMDGKLDAGAFEHLSIARRWRRHAPKAATTTIPVPDKLLVAADEVIE
jgi:hypothetical protein